MAVAGCSYDSSTICQSNARRGIHNAIKELGAPAETSVVGGGTYGCVETSSGYAAEVKYRYDPSATADPLAFYSPDRLPGWRRSVNEPDRLIYRRALSDSDLVLLVRRDAPGDYLLSIMEVEKP